MTCFKFSEVLLSLRGVVVADGAWTRRRCTTLVMIYTARVKLLAASAFVVERRPRVSVSRRSIVELAI